jgi:hypothetical protein
VNTLRSLFVAIATSALGVSVGAQYREPEFVAPWIGYEINVYPRGIEIWDATQGDFDGDGNVDLAASSWYPNPDMTVLYGDGHGGYLPPVRYPLLLGSLGIEAADMDGDGDLDLIASDTGQYWQGSTFSYFRNDGARVFTFLGNFSCGAGPSGITTGDFNNDGVLDVAVAHDAYINPGRSIAVVLGSGGGAFGAPFVMPMPSGTYDIEATDYDRDGLLDLVVGFEAPRVALVRNLGGGAFAPPVLLLPGNVGTLFRSPDVVIGDPDRDGDPDVFFSGGAIVNTGIGFVGLFRNQGNGSFGAMETIPLVAGMGGAGGLHLRDLDADGALDLLAADGQGAWALLRGDGAGGFWPGESFRAGWGPFRFATADLDHDNDIDVTVIARSSMEACVYLASGTAGFGQPAATPLVDPTLAPVSSSETEFVDIDRDGDLDFVTGYSANFVQRYGFTVRRRNANGTLAPIEDYLTPLFPGNLAVGDLSGDGYPDIVWTETFFGTGSPALRLKLNDGTGASGATRTIGSQPRGGDESDLALLDIDRDGDLDIVTTGSLASVLVFRNLGGGNFAAPLTHTVSNPVSAIAGGDFDRDGDIDLATNSGTQGYFEVSLNNGNGTFGAAFTETSGRGVKAIAVADVNRDGIPDLCGGYALDGDGATVLFGRGDGTFRPFRAYYGSYGGVTDDVQATDVDRDAVVDLVVANFMSQDVSYWRNGGAGLFERQRRYGVGESVRAVAQTDFDGDGVADLVAQVEPTSPTSSWYYPALIVLRGKPRGFDDLGAALAGARGLPVLRGWGPLTAGQTFAFDVGNALANSPAAYVLGVARADLPIFGGTLVPSPQIVIPAGVDGTGAARLTLPWPAFMARGAAVYAQAWVLDGAAVQGMAATNALRATRL